MTNCYFSFVTATNWNVDDAHIIFDWCKGWDWEIEGSFGVWDSDFRFPLYSLGVTEITKEVIEIQVNVTAGKTVKDLQNLTLTEKMQEISRAIKTILDCQYAALSSKKPRWDEISCQENSKNKGLYSKSNLCFHAIGPVDISHYEYLAKSDAKTI